MLIQQTIETLQILRLTGMLQGLREQETNPVAKELTFEERLGLLVDREAVEQDNRKLSSRLKQARLRQNAAFEDFDWRASRGMNKAALMELAPCRWIADHRNLIIIGPTGVGKTFLACSLAHKACPDGLTVLYQRAGRMFHELMAPDFQLFSGHWIWCHFFPGLSSFFWWLTSGLCIGCFQSFSVQEEFFRGCFCLHPR